MRPFFFAVPHYRRIIAVPIIAVTRSAKGDRRRPAGDGEDCHCAAQPSTDAALLRLVLPSKCALGSSRNEQDRLPSGPHQAPFGFGLAVSTSALTAPNEELDGASHFGDALLRTCSIRVGRRIFE
jgi:hypothetical protein